MKNVKRSLGIIGLISALSFVPATSFALTPSAAPVSTMSATATHSPTAGTTESSSKRAAREAAKAAYRAAMTEAQNGRDLAFADANATMMQALTLAGKDKVARKAARDSYKAEATQIITVYKEAVATAMKDYKSALAAINGK